MKHVPLHLHLQQMLLSKWQNAFVFMAVKDITVSAFLSCEWESLCHRTLQHRTPEGCFSKHSFTTLFPHVSSLSLPKLKEKMAGHWLLKALHTANKWDVICWWCNKCHIIASQSLFLCLYLSLSLFEFVCLLRCLALAAVFDPSFKLGHMILVVIFLVLLFRNFLHFLF